MAEPAAKRSRGQPKLRLFYFNVTAKGEPIRLALSHAGLEFEDVRMTFEEFRKMKEEGKLGFGQVPALEVTTGEKTELLVQTNAILRYVARLDESTGSSSKLYPDDPLQAARVDAVMDQLSDMTSGILCARYQDRFGFDEVLGGPDGEGTKKVDEALRRKVLPRHLGAFEQMLGSGSWLAGTEQPSIADFLMATQFVWEREKLKDGQALFEEFPKICDYIDRFHALPTVASWSAKHTKK
eukprot:TRINITY_DN114055_c0_g1_i1.p1 TRINITY_DN114055_c0_g1~~TRINITY_DN114055_c0_g1_i1.p1  ORF type:complete len:239 (-),score=57.83 TRINITY_DN114055_c0_g1_i1:64-780(-)